DPWHSPGARLLLSKHTPILQRLSMGVKEIKFTAHAEEKLKRLKNLRSYKGEGPRATSNARGSIKDGGLYSSC
ncbi:hypothetical protein, partial [Thermofilum sp.]|uniref:hypothetical protein n=1 Tax=Thermofilum sp. TaxID=1961369 RepID=UPI002584446B